MSIVRTRTPFVFKKREKRSALWKVPKEELGPYREEFLATGYTHMVRKYHISRADLRKLLGRKPRPVKNEFYIAVRDERTFLKLREEYYCVRSEDFSRRHGIGIRQARKLFGVKHWNKVVYPERYEAKRAPVEIDRREPVPYWKRDDYWQGRGVG